MVFCYICFFHPSLEIFLGKRVLQMELIIGITFIIGTTCFIIPKRQKK